jgi:hypothetical protein
MALKLKINKKVSEGIYAASGNLSCKGPGNTDVTGPAEVLIIEVEPNKVQLHLDSALMVSKLLNKDVLEYHNSTPVTVAAVKEGAEISFNNNMWFSLKN